MARKALIRADASVAIGTGHIHRCMTLAHALQASGWHSTFVCRPFRGDLVTTIQRNGFEVIALADDPSLLRHPVDAWPVTAVQQDAQLCRTIAQERQPDLVIVDHYALNDTWETAVVPVITRTMVVTDLYATAHVADILLNQNLGANASAYASMGPDVCRMLMGPKFALLRPEFAALRPKALARRAKNDGRKLRLLISLGGVDADNATGWLLREMLSRGLTDDWSVQVVLGGGAPYRDDVAELVRSIGSDTVLHVDTTQMADLMATADVGIGAAGSTAWERCCLGLPTIVMVLAENQRAGAKALCASSAAEMLDMGDGAALAEKLDGLRSPENRGAFSNAAAALCDGDGTHRVCDAINDLFRTGR